MILENVSAVGTDRTIAIRVSNGSISAVGPDAAACRGDEKELRLSFRNAVVFPGLINSHDHLDFNVFPATGNRIYNNYAEWGSDIHKKNKTAIDAVLKIPQRLRMQWGIYKNLLAGVTTVVHHGTPISLPGEIIQVFQQCYALHSVKFEKGWKYRINRPFRKPWPFVVHVGEGTDKTSTLEIDELLRWNLLNKELVGVHGVAMNRRQAPLFRALVWCPASNYFLLNKTAPIDQLKQLTPVLFGTDSTLTAPWNIWDHLRLARLDQQTTDEELFNMLTLVPASVWKLGNLGRIAVHQQADMVIGAVKAGEKGFNAFYALNPEDLLLVIRKGNIRLFDEALMPRLKLFGIDVKGFSKILIHDRCKWVYGDLPALVRAVHRYYPGANFPVGIPPA